MKLELLTVFLCALWEANSYPAYYPYYGPNVDAMSFGANDDSQHAMAFSRYYQPYYDRQGMGGGMAAFMFGRPQQTQQASQGYYLPDRRRQTQSEAYLPPQQNEVYYAPTPDKGLPVLPTEVNDLPVPTDRTELITTTIKANVPEITDPETDVEEVEQATIKPKKGTSRRKQVKRPIDEEDDDDNVPRMPSGAYFPMFFGWGGRSGGGPGGATAIANAYSTGRGGVASSHATAYGAPRPESTSNH